MVPPNKIRRVEEANKEVLSVRPSGRIGVPPQKWKKLDEKIKEYVRNFNAAVSHKEDVYKVAIPSNVVVQKSRRVSSIETNNSNTRDLNNKKKVNGSLVIWKIRKIRKNDRFTLTHHVEWRMKWWLRIGLKR